MVNTRLSRTPARWMRVLALGCSLQIASAGLVVPLLEAQGPQMAAGGVPDFEDPTDTSYSEWNLWRCIQVNTQVVDDDCLGDPNQEDMARNETKATHRWVMAGLLWIGQIMTGIEYMKSAYQDTKLLVENVIALAKGTNKDNAEFVAISMAQQSFRVDMMMAQTEALMMADSGHVRTGRYGDVEALVMRALSASKDADLAAISLGEQTTAMQMRLAPDGRVKVVDFNTGTTSSESLALPPLPQDAPAGAARVSLASNSISVGGVQFVSMGGPSLVAAPQRAAGAGSSSSGFGACAVPEDEHNENPMVIYERAIAMAKGAETASVAPLSAVQQTTEQLRAVAEREEAVEEETWWGALRNSIRF